METIELAYVGVEVSDVDGLARSLGEIAGLVPGDPVGASHTWRNDGKAQRIIVEHGPADDATVLGFEVPSMDAATIIVARLRHLGFTVEDGTQADCGARRVEALWHTTAPWGVPVEIVVGLADADEAFSSELMPGGFKTDGLGFGHTVFMAPDLDAAHRFVVDGLGFRQTDWLDLPIAPDISITGRFYHGNRRHHTLALIGVPEAPPQRMHHVMFETVSQDNVGAAFDRAFAAGVPIANGLGKHDNDKMFSFYFVTPAGFQIEIGHGAREVGDDWDANQPYDRISAWGHQPVTRA